MSDKKYDLEERTFQFARQVAVVSKKLVRTLSNAVYVKQLLRSSSSVGANYVEANESLGKKDFLMHVRICRKEAKESRYWLRLVVETNTEAPPEVQALHNEATELLKIFSAIIEKSK